jgi:hypothetical protein
LAGFIVFLVAITLFILITSLGAPSPAVAAVKPIPEIQYQSHAGEKHGSDALAIRKCLNDKWGADQICEAWIKRLFICGASCRMNGGDLWQSYKMLLIASGMKAPHSSRAMGHWGTLPSQVYGKVRHKVQWAISLAIKIKCHRFSLDINTKAVRCYK